MNCRVQTVSKWQ